jgi:predicted ATPase with chaperone activity
MLAKSLLRILPPGTALVSRRPFRSPHLPISDAALAGGGVIPRPGETSPAHDEVLFLDEVPELARAYERILNVGRTIADLAGAVDIPPEHLSEAIHHETLDCSL